MNIASFVDTSKSYDSFYELLGYLLSFSDSTMKKYTSIFIISGDYASGKTTLQRLVRGVTGLYMSPCEKVLLSGIITGNCLRDYSLGKPLSPQSSDLSVFNCEVAICRDLPIYYSDNDSFLRSLQYLHQAINSGITYRKMYEDDRTIYNPAVLILDVVAKQDVFSEDTFKNGNEKRKIKHIHLPHRFTKHSSDITEKCLIEIREINHVLVCLDMWLRYKLICLSGICFDIIGDCSVDVSKHLLSVLPCGVLTITSDWWKIILKMQK